MTADRVTARNNRRVVARELVTLATLLQTHLKRYVQDEMTLDDFVANVGRLAQRLRSLADDVRPVKKGKV